MKSPYVRRLRLATELRDLRIAAGLTHDQLAKKAGLNRQMISKLENGHVAPDQDDVIQILDVLGIEGEAWTELLTIADDAASRGWWESNSTRVGDRQAIFANLEAGAATIREYQQTLIPGLLQTELYTRTRVEADTRRQDLGLSIEGILKGRSGRQRMLHRLDGPTYEVLLDELAIRRASARPEVFADQLRALATTVVEDERITVRVLPVAAALASYDIPVCSFSVYSYKDPKDPVVVGIEAVTTDLVLTDGKQAAAYVGMFDGLRSAALSAEDSIDFLTKSAEAISK